MTEFKEKSQVQITIDSLAHGGAGVGRSGDFVFFVPYTAPGDEVLAEIVSVKKNYAEAKLVKLVKEGPQRRQAPCPIYGQCGGCQWQHVEYAEQLHQKQKTVEHALARIAKENDFELKQVVPSPHEFHYRNRAQVRTQGPRLGFYRRGSHELVSFDECLLLEEKLNKEIATLKTEIIGHHPEKTSKVEIYLTTSGSVQRSQNKGHGEEFGFSQVNTLQNQNMIEYVKKLAGKPSADHSGLLDLYCGNGNFSFPLADLGWDVYGIDASRSAISQARDQAQQKKAKTYFSCDDGANGVRKLLLKNRSFQTIVLDPPRIGADERLIKQLSKLNAEKLIYISCNPATFARDWARLKAHSEFKLVSVQPFDMFPQTFHVELVALAEKRP